MSRTYIENKLSEIKKTFNVDIQYRREAENSSNFTMSLVIGNSPASYTDELSFETLKTVIHDISQNGSKITNLNIQFRFGSEKNEEKLENNFYLLFFSTLFSGLTHLDTLELCIPVCQRDAAIVVIDDLIQKIHPAVNTVVLYAEQPGSEPGFISSPAIANLFVSLKAIITLRSLEVSGLNFADKKSKLSGTLIKLLEDISLKKLVFHGEKVTANNIDREHFDKILKAIKNCKSLTQLAITNLDNYNETQEDFVFNGVMEYLSGDECRLTEFTSSHYFVLNSEFVTLNSMLSKNRSLLSLKLPNLRVETMNAATLIAALRSNNTIKQACFGPLALMEKQGQQLYNFMDKKRKDLIIYLGDVTICETREELNAINITHRNNTKMVAYLNEYEKYLNKIISIRDENQLASKERIKSNKFKISVLQSKSRKLSQRNDDLKNSIASKNANPLMDSNSELWKAPNFTQPMPLIEPPKVKVHSLAQKIKDLIAAKNLPYWQKASLEEPEFTFLNFTMEYEAQNTVEGVLPDEKQENIDDFTTSSISATELSISMLEQTIVHHVQTAKKPRIKKPKEVQEIESAKKITSEFCEEFIDSFTDEMNQYADKLKVFHEFIRLKLNEIETNLESFHKKAQDLFHIWDDKSRKIQQTILTLNNELAAIKSARNLISKESLEYSAEIEKLYHREEIFKSGSFAAIKVDYNPDNLQQALTKALDTLATLRSPEPSKASSTDTKQSNKKSRKNDIRISESAIKTNPIEEEKRKERVLAYKQQKQQALQKAAVTTPKPTKPQTTHNPSPQEVQQRKQRQQYQNKFLSHGFNHLIKMTHIWLAIKPAEMTGTDHKYSESILTNIQHYALLYLIFRSFLAFQLYTRTGQGNNSENISLDISTQLRNMIIHHGVEQLQPQMVVDTAQMLCSENNLPEHFIKLRKKHLTESALTEEQIVQLVELYEFIDRSQVTRYSLAPYNIDIESTPVYQKLSEFHQSKISNDLNKEAANKYIYQQIIPIIRSIVALIKKRYPDGPTLATEGDFYDHYYQHVDALKMLLTICGEFARSLKRDPFLVACIAIRDRVGHRFPDFNYAEIKAVIDQMNPSLFNLTESKSEAHDENSQTLNSAHSKPLSKEDVCAVCTDPLDVSDISTQIMETPCGHNFHNQCIRPWLETKSNCPCCRAEVKPTELKHNLSLFNELSIRAPDQNKTELPNAVTNANQNGQTKQYTIWKAKPKQSNKSSNDQGQSERESRELISKNSNTIEIKSEENKSNNIQTAVNSPQPPILKVLTAPLIQNGSSVSLNQQHLVQFAPAANTNVNQSSPLLFQKTNTHNSSAKILIGLHPIHKCIHTFEEFFVNGDSNSNFSALGVSRSQAAKLILSAIGDINNRVLLSKQIMNKFYSGTLGKAETQKTKSLAGEYNNLLYAFKYNQQRISNIYVPFSEKIKLSTNLQIITNKIDNMKNFTIPEYCQSEEMCRSYVNSITSDGLLDRCSAIFIAERMGCNLYLWEKNNPSNLRQISCTAHIFHPKNGISIHFLYSNESTPFNLVTDTTSFSNDHNNVKMPGFV